VPPGAYGAIHDNLPLPPGKIAENLTD
jgi:hypothetical protein